VEMQTIIRAAVAVLALPVLGTFAAHAISQ
jgi:hypothetical protein